MSNPLDEFNKQANAPFTEFQAALDRATKLSGFVQDGSADLKNALAQSRPGKFPGLLPDVYDAKSYLNSSFLNDILPPRLPSQAEAMYEDLVQQIAEFEATLAPDDEIGGSFVTAPAEGVIHIESLDYRAPHLIIFHGTNQYGRAIRLVQHCSQTSVSLSAVPKQKEMPRRIGFNLEQQLKGRV